MSVTGAHSSEGGGRNRWSLALGGALLLLVVLGVLAATGVIPGAGRLRGTAFGGSDSAATVTVTGVIGSEKKAYFDDPQVQARLAELGFSVAVDTAGSRRIATEVDLDGYDFAFPSSAPAARKITQATGAGAVSTPFYSPMAVATFTPLLEELAARGVASRREGVWFLDSAKYLELAESGTRWRDLGEALPSQRTVQVSTTDVRSSNSAAMYLSMMAWAKTGGNQVNNRDQAVRTARELGPLFYNQGYTASSSAGPFADYLAKGIGAKPMVMVYEAQFLGESHRPGSRVSPEMTLAYPEPTVFSDHTVVPLSRRGARLGQMLTTDPRLQQLAAAHGFRTADPDAFAGCYAEESLPTFIDSVDPPDYELLEAMISTVAEGYSEPEPPKGEHEE